ncbi:MAG: hypothetical protein CM15mP21_4340 [Hyphomicrobiales bacterium]|nr:MAG: hypothetical protein CM15mP21_4340 [Hyphomicrobiales bacterium]
MLAIPGADGIVAEGGGSLELARVRDGVTGEMDNLPLGFLPCARYSKTTGLKCQDY